MTRFNVNNQKPPGAAQDGQGANPAPTRGPLQDRSANPAATQASGMEGAMGALADKLHPRTRP